LLLAGLFFVNRAVFVVYRLSIGVGVFGLVGFPGFGYGGY
jgi:hypothetical protein